MDIAKGTLLMEENLLGHKLNPLVEKTIEAPKQWEM